MHSSLEEMAKAICTILADFCATFFSETFWDDVVILCWSSAREEFWKRIFIVFLLPHFPCIVAASGVSILTRDDEDMKRIFLCYGVSDTIAAVPLYYHPNIHVCNINSQRILVLLLNWLFSKSGYCEILDKPSQLHSIVWRNLGAVIVIAILIN